jgi:hypothetical protein
MPSDFLPTAYLLRLDFFFSGLSSMSKGGIGLKSGPGPNTQRRKDISEGIIGWRCSTLPLAGTEEENGSSGDESEVLTVEEDGSVGENNETVSYRRLRDGGVAEVVGVAAAGDAAAASNLVPGRYDSCCSKTQKHLAFPRVPNPINSPIRN